MSSKITHQRELEIVRKLDLKSDTIRHLLLFWFFLLLAPLAIILQIEWSKTHRESSCLRRMTFKKKGSNKNHGLTWPYHLQYQDLPSFLRMFCQGLGSQRQVLVSFARSILFIPICLKYSPLLHGKVEYGPNSQGFKVLQNSCP